MQIDGLVIDGMAIGFLVFVAWYLWQTLFLKPRGVFPDIRVVWHLCVLAVMTGAAIGWLWP